MGSFVYVPRACADGLARARDRARSWRSGFALPVLEDPAVRAGRDGRSRRSIHRVSPA